MMHFRVVRSEENTIMSTGDLTETRRDRAALARDAGFSKVSFISVLAGVLVAYGAFAVLLAAAAAIAAAAGISNTLTVNNWAKIGVGSAITIAVILLLSYCFGGYVAGRMARRAGLLNGLAVFILAVLIIAVLAAIAATQVDSSAIVTNLRSLGIPTSGTEWGDTGSVAGLGSLVAMLVGAVLGGILGERWHTKLTRRAATTDTAPAATTPSAASPAATAPSAAAPAAADRDATPGWGTDRADRDTDRARADRARDPDQAGAGTGRLSEAGTGRPEPVRSERVRASSLFGGEARPGADRTDAAGRGGGRHLGGGGGDTSP